MPSLEVLEERIAPAGIAYQFIGANFATYGGQNPGNTKWSNPLNWAVNGVQQTQKYPGSAGSSGDTATFSDPKAGNCTGDASVNIAGLDLSKYGANTLTVTQPITITSATTAVPFNIDGGATLTLNAALTIQDCTNSSSFGNGIINGSANLVVQGSTLNVVNSSPELDTNMVIQGDATGDGIVNLGGLNQNNEQMMQGNLKLNGASNYIDVGGNSTGGHWGNLNLVTHIPLTADVNQWGGITEANHTQDTKSIQIDPFGKVTRSDDTNSPTSGVADSVWIAGYVQNKGGIFAINAGSATNGFLEVVIAGANANNDGYYQSAGTASVLQIQQYAQLILSDGTQTSIAEIDAGTLQGYTVASGPHPTTPNIIGNVNFGNSNPTFFNYDDSKNQNNNVGWFFIQGNVTLATSTTSTMNCAATNSDTLWLDGNLSLGASTLTIPGTTRPASGQFETFFMLAQNTEKILGALGAASDQFGDTLANGQLVSAPGTQGNGAPALAISWKY